MGKEAFHRGGEESAEEARRKPNSPLGRPDAEAMKYLSPEISAAGGLYGVGLTTRRNIGAPGKEIRLGIAEHGEITLRTAQSGFLRVSSALSASPR